MVVVTFTTRLVLFSVNQTLPSGPAVIPSGWLLALGVTYSVMRCVTGLMVAMRLLVFSVNQTLPSGPAAMPPGELLAVSSGNSAMAVVGTQRSSKISTPGRCDGLRDRDINMLHSLDACGLAFTS